LVIEIVQHLDSNIDTNKLTILIYIWRKCWDDRYLL